MQWLVVLPLEIVAASITLDFWPGAQDTNPAAWVTIFLIVIVAINFFGVRGYGEAEFVFAIIKVIAVIGFIILGIILVCLNSCSHVKPSVLVHLWPDHFDTLIRDVKC